MRTLAPKDLCLSSHFPGQRLLLFAPKISHLALEIWLSKLFLKELAMPLSEGTRNMGGRVTCVIIQRHEIVWAFQNYLVCMYETVFYIHVYRVVPF
jgi:hypothetical protein